MRTRLSHGVATLFLVVGCRTNEKPSVPFPELDTPAPAGPTLLQSPLEAPVEARMRHHATLGLAMRDAVARGDLAAAARAADLLVELPPARGFSSPPGEKLDAMILAAQNVRDAPDAQDAARAVAAVAATCGACHAAAGGRRAAWPDAPLDEPDVSSHMVRHQWAVARLWDGLAAPSDAAWKRGAQVLADAPIPAERLTPGQSPVPAIGTLARQVRDLGRSAVTLDAVPARVVLYGKVLGTCASCHERLGGGPHAP